MPDTTVYETLVQLSKQIGELSSKVDGFITMSKEGDDVLKNRLDDVESELDDIKQRVTVIEQKAGSVALKVVVEILKYVGMVALGAIVAIVFKTK